LAEDNNLLLQASSASELAAVCQTIMDENPDKVKAYQKGKKGLIGFFMGQAMKAGKNFDPEELKNTFAQLLG